MKYETQMPHVALTPFKHENGHINNNETLLLTEFKASLATCKTKPGKYTKTLLGLSHTEETQARERLYKEAPPGILEIILDFHFKLFTSQ